MKKTIAWIVVLLILLSSGCGGSRHAEVLVVEKTKSYHRDDCPRVYMANAKQMTIDEAKARNCKPCPDCKPDQRL